MKVFGVRKQVDEWITFHLKTKGFSQRMDNAEGIKIHENEGEKGIKNVPLPKTQRDSEFLTQKKKQRAFYPNVS
jgi:hypothetical protein